MKNKQTNNPLPFEYLPWKKLKKRNNCFFVADPRLRAAPPLFCLAHAISDPIGPQVHRYSSSQYMQDDAISVMALQQR